MIILFILHFKQISIFSNCENKLNLQLGGLGDFCFRQDGMESDCMFWPILIVFITEKHISRNYVLMEFLSYYNKIMFNTRLIPHSMESKQATMKTNESPLVKQQQQQSLSIYLFMNDVNFYTVFTLILISPIKCLGFWCRMFDDATYWELSFGIQRS